MKMKLLLLLFVGIVIIIGDTQCKKLTKKSNVQLKRLRKPNLHIKKPRKLNVLIKKRRKLKVLTKKRRKQNVLRKKPRKPDVFEKKPTLAPTMKVSTFPKMPNTFCEPKMVLNVPWLIQPTCSYFKYAVKDSLKLPAECCNTRPRVSPSI